MRQRPHSKKPGRRSKPVNVTQDEIDLIRKVGGPTFTPLTGERYRCNQLRHLGRLTREQVAGVREACGFHGTKPEEKPPVVVRVVVVESLRQVRQSQDFARQSQDFARRSSWQAALGHRQGSTVRW